MIRTRILGREVTMQGSPWTLVEYSRAFGADLLADFAEAVKGDTVELAEYLKFAWALCRTADPKTSDFERWCREFDDFTLAGGEGQACVSVIDSAVMAELFRRPQARLAGIRRWLRTRRLGWLSRRRCAR